LQAVACGYVLFFGAKKRTKRNIHPHQTSPYIGRLKKFLAETDEKFYVLVSRDFAMIFFIGWRMDTAVPFLPGRGWGECQKIKTHP
jgi:hypothetical protein